MIIQNTRGEMVDLTTGQVVGAPEGATPAAAAPVDARKPTGVDQETMGSDKVMGLVNNLSWGFNSALFALPDMAQRGIGAAMGLDKDQVFQFTKLFNRGEKTPVNSGERYARAIGEGIGGTMPITGVLGYAAAVSPVVRMAKPGAGVLKGIADDAISFVQKSPKLAAAMDVAFSAGYETMRQGIEENVSDDNEYKSLYKELLPAAAFMGVPLAAANLPSVRAAGFLKKKIEGASSGMGEIEKEVMSGLPGVYKLPLVKIVPTVLMKNAERKLAQVFGPISESPEAQQALKQLEAAMADPRVGEAGFMFDAAESTMYSPLVQRKAELLQQLGPKELESTKQRINENQKKLQNLFQSFSPQARQPVEDAFRAAQAERQSFFENLLKQQKDMSEAEVAAVSERLGPQNIDMLNDELRGVLMARMEMDSVGREKILSRMGLRQGVSEEGLPVATRDNGKSLFPARDMEQAAVSLIEKYKPERPSMYVKTPEPIRLLERFVQSQQVARDQMESKMVTQLADQAISEQLRNVGTDLPADFQKALRDSIMTVVRGEKAKGRRRGVSMADLGAAPDAQGNIAVATGIPGRRIIVNPEQIRADAKRIAEADTGIDINLPEALDYLQSAIRFRNDSLSTYNNAMGQGRTRITDAQRYLDTGDAVFKDIEGLILQHVPKIRNEYEGMKMVLDDYRAGYEQSLPLLMAQKKGKGDEFLLPNEALMQKAFASADNLRQLQISLMNSPEAGALVERGAVDWMRSKGVVNADGLVDPKKIRQVLDKNRNIVEALPETVRTKLQDEVQLAEDYVARLGELDARRVNAKNNELDSILAKAVRPDANAANIMETALRDPATMRVLVDQLGKDPENLAALRRSVYGIATEGAQGGGALRTFIDKNEKSLGVLFKDTNHLNDLKTLADLQRRVNAFADVTGQIPAFESLDESLKRVFGSGIQYLTTTAREAAVGRINPTTGALALMVRLTGSLENQLYQRIFTKALEDPTFARRITQVGTPAEAKAVAAELEKIGISPTKYVPTPVRITAMEAAQAAQDEETAARVPQRQAETARQMLQRTLPVAPPTRGTSFNPRLPTTPPAGPATGGVNLMYPALFPNDPISGLLQQRQAAMQRPAQ
jgi:hypothetical protein